MMKMNRWILAAGMALLVGVSAGNLQAQDNGGNGGGQGRRGPGGMRFDPTQMRQMLLDGVRQEMNVTNDTEWNVIKVRLEKVVDARQANMGDMAGGMGRIMRRMRPEGGNGADRPQRQGGGQGGQGGRFGQSSPETQALEKVVDNTNASSAEVKAALAKFQEARKAKQAALEKAQTDLRQILTPRQEAVATVFGLL
jgi:hypothetical protein